MLSITGVVKLVPVPSDTPPVAAAHHLIVPLLDVAPRVTVPGPQLLPDVVPVIVGIGFTVTDNAGEELELHKLIAAVTETLPLFDPTVAWIESLVELPLHPEGKIHLYDVAPVTGETL